MGRTSSQKLCKFLSAGPCSVKHLPQSMLGAWNWKQWGQHPAKRLSQRWAGSTCLVWRGLCTHEMIWSQDPCSRTPLHGAFPSMKHCPETDVVWDVCCISLEASSESGRLPCKVQSDVSFASGRTLGESSPAWDHPGVQITTMDRSSCLTHCPWMRGFPRNFAETKNSATLCQVSWKRKHMPGSQWMWFGMPKEKYILPWDLCFAGITVR